MFPFFSDQFGKSLIIERSKLGGILQKNFTPSQALELFGRVLDDQDGAITRHVKKYQALIQIHSRRGVAKGVNLIEEVAYTHEDGLLQHPESTDQRMNYLKSHDLDLYGALLAVAGLGVWATAAIMNLISLNLKGTFCTEGKDLIDGAILDKSDNKDHSIEFLFSQIKATEFRTLPL